MGRRAFLTGTTGFIGAQLARNLAERGDEVYGLVRAGSDRSRLTGLDIQFREGGFGDLERLLAEIRPEVIFHLATPRGHGAEAWQSFIAQNVQAALGLVSHLRRFQATRLVVAGSSLEYGPSELPHRETDPLRPTTWHGTGKAAAGLIFSQGAGVGLAITQLRLFHVYGPWESPYRLLPTALRAALAGTPLPFTAQEARRDWIHVDDVVKAFLAAAQREMPCGIFNVGSGREASNTELVAAVEAVTGHPLSLEPGAFPVSSSDTPHRVADLAWVRERLGWTPSLSLVEGVDRSLTWYQANPAFWDAGTIARPGHV
jgi:nucleoside-diphosphate-sugar epimerase